MNESTFVQSLRDAASDDSEDGISKLKRNIYKYIQLAHPVEIDIGISWYDEAHHYARMLAEEFDVSTEIVAHVISALSPFNVWEQNKIDTINLLQAVKTHTGPTSLIVFTFYGQKLKAWDIATTGDISLQSGRKTVSFGQNIARPKTSVVVTIDRHALGAALDTVPWLAKKVSLTNHRYDVIERAYKELSTDLCNENTLFARANELQAIVWLVYRRLFGNKRRFESNSEGQPELFG